jgi:hypothetical protein
MPSPSNDDGGERNAYVGARRPLRSLNIVAVRASLPPLGPRLADAAGAGRIAMPYRSCLCDRGGRMKQEHCRNDEKIHGAETNTDADPHGELASSMAKACGTVDTDVPDKSVPLATSALPQGEGRPLGGARRHGGRSKYASADIASAAMPYSSTM